LEEEKKNSREISPKEEGADVRTIIQVNINTSLRENKITIREPRQAKVALKQETRRFRGEHSHRALEGTKETTGGKLLTTSKKAGVGTLRRRAARNEKVEQRAPGDKSLGRKTRKMLGPIPGNRCRTGGQRKAKKMVPGGKKTKNSRWGREEPEKGKNPRKNQ